MKGQEDKRQGGYEDSKKENSRTLSPSQKIQQKLSKEL